jgi:hypothetical protein
MNLRNFKKYAAVIAVLLLPALQPLSAQILVNEVYVNPPGTDSPYEFIELKGQPGTVVNNMYAVVFEGDSASAGRSDLVIPLHQLSIGSSGIILIATTIGYSSVPVTTSYRDTLIFGVPGGILENGNTTFAVIFSPTPIFSDVDYDSNNDGVLDLPTGAVLQDAVGWTNGDESAIIYGGVILTQSAGTPDAAVRFYGNTTAFSLAAWYNGDISEDGTFDPLEVSGNFPAEASLTPGGHNAPNGGLSTAELDVNFSLYPVPCSDVLTIRNQPLNEAVSVEVYDIQGKLMFTAVTDNGEIPEITRLENGFYVLKAAFPSGILCRKFSVLR